tara:strand:+ start:19872 stop:20783 length:912 start_codon:yes stop_codon:yes gene_type:complete
VITQNQNMNNLLLNAVDHYAQAHADAAGVAITPFDGLTIVRVTAPSELQHSIQKPLVCLVLQGVKHVAIGTQALSLSPGDSMLITADLPTASQIITASEQEPYLALALDLDLQVITDLTTAMEAAPVQAGVSVQTKPTEKEIATSALRMMELLARPESIPILQAQLVREMHYWLLVGQHGPAIRRLGWPDAHIRRVARAVSVLRTEYAKPLTVEQLAASAGMSPSSFFNHFRKITSLSPLQFQKQLRLIEARRLMLAEGSSASHAAFTVGYESASQFTREYRRMFGRPPAQDTQEVKRKTHTG